MTNEDEVQDLIEDLDVVIEEFRLEWIEAGGEESIWVEALRKWKEGG
jgi:hypothetical protein